MNEGEAFAYVVFFGVITVLLVRSREVPWWVAVLIGLFGFYLGQTPAFFMISEFVVWIFDRFAV
ncbi:hypothetical protein HLK59_32620 [Streptomyces sp. S3(2020)]|uniref:hypothetical protein n=1 Tax=unclassified Streptomyces TaxID=2593676 RepID=UPI001488238D|nr:hypothetical protein [Streptomyces sp. S3(2020)]NNN35026.1 hypothetical protein [Streptomyces sp. S3(2020)]